MAQLGPVRAAGGRTAPPLAPAHFVDRRRLREVLASAVPIGLAVVIAPGGFGKTVALADFAARAPFPVAWLTVTSADGDLVAFVDALVGALRRVVPRFGRQLVKISRKAGPGTASVLAAELADDLAEYGAPLALILDDLHTVDGVADVAQLIGAFVDLAPPNLFLALASRTLPALPYARLLALGKLAGIPADELRFTRDETALFMGRAPEDAAVERIHDATGGWATAVVLGDRAAPFDGALDEYLEHEVFGQQPPEVRDFLLRAAVPPHLDEEICRRVLGAPNGPRHLTRAQRAGLFVAALPDGGWRLHDIFRDFLRARLRRHDPALWQELNRAVADELAATGRPAEAITQLVGADMAEAAADRLLRHGAALATEGRWGAIRRWLDRLPAPVIEARPRLLALQGRALMPSSPSTALGLFDRAIERCLASGDDLGAAEALAYRAARLMISSRYTEVAEDCQRVRALLGEQDHPALAIATRVEGLVAARTGDFATAFATLDDALARARRLRDRALIAMAERSLGWAHSAAGGIGPASAHYERAARIWSEVGDLSALAEIRVSLGYTYAEQGANDLARGSFEEAARLGDRLGETRVRGFALDNLAVLSLAAGDAAGAIRLLREALDLARQSEDSQLLATSLDKLSRCHRLMPDGLADAEALARQAIAEAELGSFGALAARARVTLASTVLAQGRPAEALAAAGEALAGLEKTGQRAEMARAAAIRAVAARALGDEGWPAHLEPAAAALDELRNVVPAVVEVRALADELRTMATDPRASSTVLGLLALAEGPTPGAAVVPGGDPTTPLPSVEARLFGHAELLVDDAPPKDPARFWTRRPTRLLFFLLEQARPGLPADTIIDRIWPDAEPGQGQTLLWDTVHRLRAVLGGDRRRRGRDLVQLQGQLYRLNPALPLKTDVAAFEATATRALGATPGSAEEIEALEAADALYGGPYLENVHDHWTQVRRRDLGRLHARVLRRLIERELATGASERAVALTARLARLAPRSAAASDLQVRALVAVGESERAGEVRRAFARRVAPESPSAPGAH